MRNPICKNCLYKRFTCSFFPCKVYIEAQLKKTERRFLAKFGDDFDAEDQYTAGLITAVIVTIAIILFAIDCMITVIGEWIT